ncbi:MAG: FtsL-like putative cell division protein [Bacteroidota bacterium]
MRIISQKRTGTHNSAPQKEGPAKGLSVKKVNDYLRFMAFLALIGLAYIGNSHYAEKQVREREALRKEVKALKDQYFLKASNFGAGLKFSEIAEMTDSLGLRKLEKPPYKLEAKHTFPK